MAYWKFCSVIKIGLVLNQITEFTFVFSIVVMLFILQNQIFSLIKTNLIVGHNNIELN